MARRPQRSPLLLAALVLACSPALALKAHQHGVAEVDLVREGGHFEIQLKADGEGIVGFERAPRDDAERAKSDAARVALENGAVLFALPPGAGCRLTDSDVDVPHAAAGKHGHDPEHHDGRGVAKADAHADWRASYRFECQRGAAADSVDLAGLFSAFPGITRARLQWITDHAQSGTELRPGRSQASLVAE